jgi:hypothetical protein
MYSYYRGSDGFNHDGPCTCGRQNQSAGDQGTESHGPVAVGCRARLSHSRGGRPRASQHHAHYLSIKDDGDGVPRDADGLPDFKYVATHICDSIKRHLKFDGQGSGLQGEFGIGLLSFWTVGDTLTMTSTGTDQRAYQMTMSKGDSRYEVAPRRVLFAEKGTELRISPCLRASVA